MQTVIFNHLIFVTLSGKNVKTVSKIKKEPCVQANVFFTFLFLKETLAPHNKKRIRMLVWNKTVSRVKSSNKSLWNKF